MPFNCKRFCIQAKSAAKCNHANQLSHRHVKLFTKWKGSSLEFYYDAVAESIRAEHPGLGLNALCCIHDCLRCPTTCYYLHRGCRLNES